MPVKSRARDVLVVLGVAVAVFWVAFDGGSYGLDSRAMLAIAVWWAILMAFVLGLWPAARPPRASLVAGGFLAAFAAVTAASIAWAASAERAVAEANRVALFVGVFAVAVLGVTRGTARRFSDGIAVAITAIGLLALASRLFPDVLPAGEIPEFLPSAFARLSWPVEYWNGLAILVALALPLLFRLATDPENAAVRGLAVGVVPALTATLYLTSSRGGFATALVGVLCFWLLTPQRLATGLALGLAVAGSIAAVAVLLARDAVVDDPFGASRDRPGTQRRGAPAPRVRGDRRGVRPRGSLPRRPRARSPRRRPRRGGRARPRRARRRRRGRSARPVRAVLRDARDAPSPREARRTASSGRTS